MQTPPYRLLTYRAYTGLLCLVCNRISWHPRDVQEHYCGACHLFLDTLPADFVQECVEGRAPGLLLGRES